MVALGGRPMIAWPLAALRQALGCVAVVAKPDTELPALPPGVDVWREPSAPTHPLTGILEALRRAEGRAVLVCAVDLQLIDATLVARLARAPAERAPAVVTVAAGRVQPLLARYEPQALDGLRGAAPDAGLVATVLALGPALLDVPSAALLNVNDREDLRRAEQAIGRWAGDDWGAAAPLG